MTLILTVKIAILIVILIKAVKDDSLNGATNDFGDPVRKYKVLCYEDITLWIVKDPNQGESDVLVMKVCFQYHKGLDNKPKL